MPTVPDSSILSRASGPRHRHHDRPNIVLICVDQMRGDALSVAGHQVIRTPHLDELAGQGTRFSRAYSATPTCVPARVGLFTGQSQESHGRTGYRDGIPFTKAHPVTMQGVLRENGYQTQAIGKMHVYPERARCGFDDVILHDGFLHFGRRYGHGHLDAHDDHLRWLRRQPETDARADYFEDGVGCNSMVAIPWNRPERLHPTNWAVQEAVDWLDRRDPDVPFFLYLSFHRPHAPFNPPRWAFDMYHDQPSVEPPVGDWIGDFEEFRRDDHHQTMMGKLRPDEHHRAVSGYYGNISHIDLQLNRFLEALADHELTEDTAIVFVSDHGDMMGDHDMYRKSNGFEGSAHVPMIIKAAPRFADGAPTGAVVDQVTELRDVMPTVLAMAGVGIPDGVDGMSLLPYVQGDGVREWRDHIHGEHVTFGQSLQWVTDGKRKYLWASGSGAEQFFDLEVDPHELHNLVRDEARVAEVEHWRGLLITDLTGREEGFVADGELITGRPVQTEQTWVRELVDS